MRAAVLALLLAGLAVPCAPALAATVRVDYARNALIYRAAPGERNKVRITASTVPTAHDDTITGFTVEDGVSMDLGTACRRISRRVAECELFGSARAIVRLGDRDDRLRVLARFDNVEVDGGRGDDVLIGGPEDDTLLGGRGTDDLRGGAGVDRLFAGSYGGLSTEVTADRMRGGRDSDLIAGSAGSNLIEPGPGVDKVLAGGGRDIVLTRDGTIEQIHCGAGEDSGVTDGFDFPLACEHHEPYSRASPVPVSLFRVAGEPPAADMLIGCRENHRAICAGTVQLEAGGSPLSDEVAFQGANRHRLVANLLMSGPLPADWPTRPDVLVRIRARDAAGVPTDDRYPVRTMLVGDPFLN